MLLALIVCEVLRYGALVFSCLQIRSIIGPLLDNILKPEPQSREKLLGSTNRFLVGCLTILLFTKLSRAILESGDLNLPSWAKVLLY